MTADRNTVAEDGYQERDDCAEAVAVARDEQVLLSDLIAEAVAAARAEERGRIADEIAGSFPLNGELRHDGSADPLASAYVEGLHDAWSIAKATP